jgi:hypothetical protein
MNEIVAVLRRRFPTSQAQPARHLLRDLEPAVGGEGAHAQGRPAARRRLAQLVELAAAGGRRRTEGTPPTSSTTWATSTSWLDGCETVGLTSGASAPEHRGGRLRVVRARGAVSEQEAVHGA